LKFRKIEITGKAANPPPPTKEKDFGQECEK
jgi:hypothetical protein